MRQPLRYPWLNLDVDDLSAPVIAVRVDADGTTAEVPDHQHRKGQLVVSLGGGVTCRVPGGLWMVPPHCAVWVPGGMRHSNLATANARLFFVYIEPEVVDLPDRCCTLSISPLLRELIVELSDGQLPSSSGTAIQGIPASRILSRACSSKSSDAIPTIASICPLTANLSTFGEASATITW